MAKPETGSYPAHFETYVSKVPEQELMEAFTNQREIIDNYFDSITEEQSAFAYAPGKWTLKEMLQHIIDAERIFNYRALSFARKETTSLPGFEEDAYAAASDAQTRSWDSLCWELKAARLSTEMLFGSFTPEMLQFTGLANNKEVNAHAIGFITIGHLYHHMQVIDERYLPIIS